MLRCDRPAGIYKITLKAMHEKLPYHVQIGGHQDVLADVGGERKLVEEAAWVGNEAPREIELCVHELNWLQSGIPGKDYPMHYEFTLEKVKGK